MLAVRLRNRGFLSMPLVYLIAGIAFLAMLYGLVLWVDTHWETRAGVKKGRAEVQAQWDEAIAEQKSKEQQQTAKAEKGLEVQSAKVRTVTRTITQQVDRFVDRAVYKAECFDNDGLKSANEAIAGKLYEATTNAPRAIRKQD